MIIIIITSSSSSSSSSCCCCCCCSCSCQFVLFRLSFMLCYSLFSVCVLCVLVFIGVSAMAVCFSSAKSVAYLSCTGLYYHFNSLQRYSSPSRPLLSLYFSTLFLSLSPSSVPLLLYLDLVPLPLSLLRSRYSPKPVIVCLKHVAVCLFQVKL